MNIALWTIAALLAVIFLASGAVKLARSKEQLVASGMGAVEDFSPGAVRTIGVLETLAAIGLIVPAAVDVAPVMVPVAAVGVALLMVGAAVVHFRRSEVQGVAATTLFLALAAFVAWGRFGPESFTG
ncbi:DoxX family protein [Spirillospora sp. NPDC048819]|uniref:DoxX family protein n=1 Tax=Spirillospora sp. NPDC048819 TaxID=3155268 RepID=UPI0033F53DD7